MSPGFFKFGEDTATFRNFIRLRERKKLAELLDVEVIAPTEKISVDDFGEFIHDKKENL